MTTEDIDKAEKYIEDDLEAAIAIHKHWQLLVDKWVRETKEKIVEN